MCHKGFAAWARGQHCLPLKLMACIRWGVKRKGYGGSRREVLSTSHWPGVPPPVHGRSRCSLALIRGEGKLAGRGATVKGAMEKEIRCGNCNRLLARGEALALTIKCPRCGCMNHVRATSPNVEGPRASPERSSEPNDL